MATVFLSYRQENPAHSQRVRALADRLEADGVTVVLDQLAQEREFYGSAPPRGWPLWSTGMAENTPSVLIYASPGWFQVFKNPGALTSGKGAAVEAETIHTRLYVNGGYNDFAAVVYSDAGDDLKDLPLALDKLGRFDITDSSAFTRLITWLNRPIPAPSPSTPATATTATSAATSPVTITWPSRSTAFVPDMANRQDEFAFFADTLSGCAPQRATLIAAESGHGKTRLVSEFYKYGRDRLGDHACCLVDFKSRGTVENLLDTIAADLAHCIPGAADRSASRLREGLRRATHPILFVFDTVESATDDARQFVETHFLAEMGRAQAMRLLVAGQPHGVPDPAKAAWEEYARRFDLPSMPDPQPWVEWAARKYPHLPATAVIAIVASVGGIPATIANQISRLGKMSATQLAALGIR